MTRIIAIGRNIRQSPQKVRLVANWVKDLSLSEAITQLGLSTKRASKSIQKVLESAIANAEHNFKIKKEDLKIKEIQVGPARTLRRVKPRARGKADVIRKRSSHVRVVLEDG